MVIPATTALSARRERSSRCLVLLLMAALAGSAMRMSGAPPGVVVAHSPATTRQYLGSPSLARLPNGELIASHDLFGPGSTSDTIHVYASQDHGATWTRRSETRGFWSSLFVHREALYLLGTLRQDGWLVLRRSTDGGVTWTSPSNSLTGLLRADANYHTAPMPVVLHDGRLWRAFEDVMGPGGWGSNFRSFLMSVSVEADLLDARNWTFSNRLGRDPQWLGGQFGGWLEGNVVVTPDGRIVNILRADYRYPDEKAALIEVSSDGATVSFNPERGFIDFPGGCKKFTVRRDPRDGSYWSLANWIPPSQRGGNVERTRNTLALLHSADLRRWEVRCVLLHHPDRERHGFQYADFVFDGSDLMALVRTAFADEAGGAHNAHDANFITFHRWPNFRSLTTADSVPIGTAPSASTFTNPVVVPGADPWIVFRNGSYWFTATAGNRIDIRRSPTLAGLPSAAPVTIWRAPATGPQSRDIWAPEFHWVNHRWCVYFTATDERRTDAHRRIYALESTTDDLQGPFVERGKIAVPGADHYAIDGTLFPHPSGQLYFLWSGREQSEQGPQNIYIAPMSDPWTLSGPRVKLSSPDLAWEQHGWQVNEGPEVLHRNGRTFVVYSGSGFTTPEYSLGLLTNSDGDLLNPESWTKSATPVFKAYIGDDGKVFGPGHNGFFQSPDGTEDWIVYHAWDQPETKGLQRTARAQKFSWRADGTPDFGQPIPPGVPVRVPSGEKSN